MRETIKLYCTDLLNVLTESLNLNVHQQRWFSFRVKVALTTVTICLIIFAAMGITVLYNQNACRRGDLTRSGHHALKGFTKSRIIEAITTEATKRHSRPPPHLKDPRQIHIFGIDTTTTRAHSNDKSGLWEQTGHFRAAPITDALLHRKPCPPALVLRSSESVDDNESHHSVDVHSAPSLLCKLFYGSSTASDRPNIITHSWKPTTKRPHATKRGSLRNFHPPTTEPGVDILGLHSTTTTTTEKPSTSSQQIPQIDCQYVCRNEPERGGQVCRCDEPPMFELRLSMPTVRLVEAQDVLAID